MKRCTAQRRLWARVSAAKTGEPERPIQHNATCAKALGPEPDCLAVTFAGKGAKLEVFTATQPRAPRK